MVTQTLLFALLGVAVVVGGYLVQHFLAPKGPSPSPTPYECGEKPSGSPWASFEWPFLRLAALLLLLEAEVLFALPWVWVQRELSQDLALAELVILLLPLSAAYIYLLRNGYFFPEPTPPKHAWPPTYQALQKRLLALHKEQQAKPTIAAPHPDPIAKKM